MRCLLDTHALLWMITDDKRLGNDARQAILDSENRMFFSMASFWEICIKISLGKLKLADKWEETIDKEMLINGIEWLPIRQRHLLGIIDLPFHHRDPFDRLLVSQARQEELTIITSDTSIHLYDVCCLF